MPHYNIKQKDGTMRIGLEPDELGNVDYLRIEPTRCWRSTFKKWGKSMDDPIVQLRGKSYRVSLTEITD